MVQWQKAALKVISNEEAIAAAEIGKENAAPFSMDGGVASSGDGTGAISNSCTAAATASAATMAPAKINTFIYAISWALISWST